MNTTMITAINAMGQLQKKIDVTGNNIANVDTTGYKAKQGNFTDMLYQQIQVKNNTTEGSLLQTGRDLDTAFQKEGQYYKVLDQNNKVQFTRDGAFELSPVAANENMLVTTSGNPVLDENNNPIIITGTPSQYQISQNGQMTVTKADGTAQSFNLGVIQVNNPQFFEQKGNNLIGLPDNVAAPNGVYTDLTGAARSQISIGQGKLEQSNVDLSKEMTDLMSTQRLYQFQSRAVSLSDQMMGLINGMRR